MYAAHLTAAYNRNTSDIHPKYRGRGCCVMAKKTTNRGKSVDPGTPLHPGKEAFARKAYQLMLKKGWRQSELARNADLPRDAISVYMRGQSLPTPGNLKKLAKALGVEPDELLPAHLLAEQHRIPLFEIKNTDQPNVVLLRVNQEVPLSVALKIAELLNAQTVD